MNPGLSVKILLKETERIKNEKGAIKALSYIENNKPSESDDFRLINKLASLLFETGQSGKAEKLCRESLKIAFENPSALNLLGKLKHERGNTKEAAALYTKSLKIRPDYTEAWFNLCRAAPGNIGPMLDTLKENLENNDKKPEEKVLLNWCLGKYHDSEEQYDMAFSLISKSKKLRAALPGNKFDLKSHEFYINWLIENYSEDLIKRNQNRPRKKPPVFIIGMPRSGTTLVEQVLSSHSSVIGGGELPWLPDIEKQIFEGRTSLEAAGILQKSGALLWEKASKLYSKKAGQFAGNKIITDKLPDNYRRAGFIKLLFPDAPIIHCRRNPLDNCISCFFTMFTNGHHYSNDLRTLGRYYLIYKRIADHWDKLPGPGILNVDYENMVENPEYESRRIIEYCRLNWEEVCLDFSLNKRRVRTASASQVRRKIYTSSVGRWKRYEKHIRELKEILSAVI